MRNPAVHGSTLPRPDLFADYYRDQIENRINQHLSTGLKTIPILTARGVDALHSRKLRSFGEPAFR